MINPLDYIDVLLMKGINAGNHTWNWTTGRTKEDLANILQIGAATVALVGPFSDNLDRAIVSTIVCGPIELYLTKVAMRKNREQIELENRALEKKVIDTNVETFYKPLNKLIGYSYGVASLVFNRYRLNESHISQSQDLSYHYSGLISGPIRTAGCLVMCADNLPPRKNCIRRGLDKVAKILNDIKSPGLTYIPVPI